MSAIRVLVADDHTLVRESLVNVLDASGLCTVVAQAADGLAAVEKALQVRPDVAIVDISMPGLNGIEVVRRLHAELPETRTLVLTMHEDEEYVLHVVRAGAAGYLLKDSPISELIKAVQQLHAGRAHFGAAAARVLANQVQKPEGAAGDPYGRLTPREREVFHMIVEGRTSKEIAAKLGISTKTAENHRANVLDKLDARNTADVVRYAVRRGLLD
jgi:two-component system, NarL family, response regulator NreC